MNELATLPPPVRLVTDLRARGDRLLGQPAVRRALPAIATLLAIGATLVAWLLLRTPEYRVVLPALVESDKAAVLAALKTGNIAARVDPVCACTRIDRSGE